MLRSTTKKKFPRKTDEQGATMVEYALTIVLIAFVALMAIGATGKYISADFGDVADCMDTDCPIISGGGQQPGGP